MKFGDLGGARYTSAGGVIDKADGGNARYRAPEVDGGSFSGKADVYSVGLVLAELVLRHLSLPGFECLRDPFQHFAGDLWFRRWFRSSDLVFSEAIRRLHTIAPSVGKLFQACWPADPKNRCSASDALLLTKVHNRSVRSCPCLACSPLPTPRRHFWVVAHRPPFCKL